MDSFSTLAVWGVSGLISVLAWRLYTALRASQDLESNVSEKMDALKNNQVELDNLKSQSQAEKQSLTDQLNRLQTQFDQQKITVDQVTRDHQILQNQHRALKALMFQHQTERQSRSDQVAQQKKQVNQKETDLAQMAKDHQALQNRHRALEQDLLNQMSLVSAHDTELQNYRLAKANLSNQIIQLNEKKKQVEKEAKNHQIVLIKTKELLQEAQKKILLHQQEAQSFKAQKKQLERELQRELQRNVALEDQINVLDPGCFDHEATPKMADLFEPAVTGPSLPTFTSCR